MVECWRRQPAAIGIMIFIAVGNTRTLLAQSNDGLHFQSISAATALHPAHILQQWEQLRPHAEEETFALGGVVPEALQTWRELLPEARLREPDLAVFNQRVPNAYVPGETLGFDRRCCLLAAAQDYPAQSSIIIDMGTAITIDLFADGRFQGGRILPGITMSLHALFLGTALLPDMDLPVPAAALGNSTGAAIQSGVFHLFADALQGAITHFQQMFPGARVLLTGGDAALWQAQIPNSQHVPDLLLRGFYGWLQA
ncbi:type III pantothenate kinase [Acidithiobacillus sp. HP-6]|uniref:type III pantothenate kinase n=1 Tax=unclassified Acidithiobacillus TaxID=2614800 RepID=UPI00187A6197|nr:MULTISPECIES: type III pantothenate kinase [unclassified Acidithiobacillus]MBE7563221.1 type III pantothenate kinase [Acidithiobacillus sp. HP-6]MBE7570159.1 type III pantothenate kinase [Acidithiobacillus sp. HP-2]